MDKNQFKRVLSSALLLGLPLIGGPAVYAAKPVDLNHQRLSILPSFNSGSAMSVKETRRSVDMNQTLHVRVQEMYAGYPVWGADAVVHIPNGAKLAKSAGDVMGFANNAKGSMDGTFYQDLQADLAKAPALVLSSAQAQKALTTAVETKQKQAGAKLSVKDKQTKLMVFVDKQQKAHWAYQVSFYAAPVKAGALPSKPVYIMDATSLQVYAQWDDIKTAHKIENADIPGGGFGGNLKMGKLVYDGTEGQLAQLSITRDADTNTCYLKNSEVTVINSNSGDVMSFACSEVDADHANLYWDGDQDAVNDGYSPSNDALFGGKVIKDMYQKWYGVPVLTENGEPMPLTMAVHEYMDNAYWDGRKMTFGDGIDMFYPLTSLGVAAHEISHGFTEQHSNLAYYSQSGGMNEAFSDMAAQAAEYYAYGKNSWQIGPEIFKAENEALRYMDKPSTDCHGKKPGDWCSIDEVSQYEDGIDVHHSSGIYNRLFYLMGTSEDWNAKKAFDVMVQANTNYWTSSVDFEKGACGILKATKDLGYDLKAVQTALTTVGIDTSNC